jgi:hypothetical protein
MALALAAPHTVSLEYPHHTCATMDCALFSQMTMHPYKQDQAFPAQ